MLDLVSIDELIKSQISADVNIKDSTKLSDSSIVYKLETSNNLLFIIHINNKYISYTVYDYLGNKKDDYKKLYDTDDELVSIIKIIIGVLNIMNNDKTMNTKSKEDDNDILLEDSTLGSLDEELNNVKDYITRAADRITELSNSTDDVEMKEVISSLANSAYGLAIDIDDAIETYQELQEEEEEIPDDSEDLELDT